MASKHLNARVPYVSFTVPSSASTTASAEMSCDTYVRKCGSKVTRAEGRGAHSLPGGVRLVTWTILALNVFI